MKDGSGSLHNDITDHGAIKITNSGTVSVNGCRLPGENVTKPKKYKKKKWKATGHVSSETELIDVVNSSNKSNLKQKNGVKNGEAQEITKLNDSESVDENEEVNPKLNAFQFMMNNRHKSIDHNSPGRDVDLSKSDIVDKEKIKARKNLFESWAELKGASKRKREFEETGNCISYKLKKRAKKLKEMLSINNYCSDDEVFTKRRNRCNVIDSDSDNSSDSPVESIKIDTKSEEKRKIVNKNGRLSLIKIDNELNSNDGELKSISNSVKQWKMKIKANLDLNKDEGISRKGHVQNGNNELSKNENSLDNRMVLRSRKPKPKVLNEEFIFWSDEEDTTKKQVKKILKVAPVFMQAVPKPKLDPEVVEARRQFLLSGVPSSLKKEMEKQQSIEEMYFDVFPVVSHVQQRSQNNIFWDLPKVDLKLIDRVAVKFDVEFNISNKLIETCVEKESDFSATPNSIVNLRKIIKIIKSQNPNYPVYKMFKCIYNKSGYKTKKEELQELKPTPKQRSRNKKKIDKNIVISQPTVIKLDDNVDVYAMWTEKYKAKTSNDVIGNHSSVASLKEWLKKWLNVGTEVKKKSCDSDSEFDIADGDSGDTTKLYGNTIILKGPSGSGKTTAAYAVCNELGFNVLEVNASSKRTGKRLLQELQEATQSHQVRKKERLSSFVIEDKEEKPSEHKMCVLLVEDVNIVFEQDEGFISALTQIIVTSKRPIILTTTDETPSNIQKFISHRQIIYFSPLPSVSIIWLQIVCLIEGLHLDTKCIEELLNCNGGDIRKTLLQLQFWVTSGGQRISNNEISNNIVTKIELDSELVTDDDNLNLSDLKQDELNDNNEDVEVHRNCINSFEIIKDYGLFKLPYYNNFKTIWWNLPNILNLSNFSMLRLQHDEQNCCSDLNINNNLKEKQKLRALSNLYDSLAFGDIYCGRHQFHESLKPKWHSKPKDGIGLEEVMTSFNDTEFINELTLTLLSGTVKMYKENCDNAYSKINMAVPLPAERKWYLKQMLCEEKLGEALVQLDCLERKSVTLDYMSCLRSIAKSEIQREANNTKRGNRFYNYLRNLGVSVGNSTHKFACNVFKIID